MFRRRLDMENSCWTVYYCGTNIYENNKAYLLQAKAIKAVARQNAIRNVTWRWYAIGKHGVAFRV